MNTKEIEIAVDNKLIEWGIEYRATFIPWSQSRNYNEKTPSLNWAVDFIDDFTNAFSTDFTQGIGHVPGWNFPYSKSVDGVEYYKKVAETGKYHRTPETIGDFGFGFKPLPIPPAAEALSCLLLDDEARNYTFEDWATNYGYDTDSRKAEAIYRECLDIGIRLRYVFTQAQLNELAQILKEY